MKFTMRLGPSTMKGVWDCSSNSGGSNQEKESFIVSNEGCTTKQPKFNKENSEVLHQSMIKRTNSDDYMDSYMGISQP